jgi:hypothetical protein
MVKSNFVRNYVVIEGRTDGADNGVDLVCVRVNVGLAGIHCP